MTTTENYIRAAVNIRACVRDTLNHLENPDEQDAIYVAEVLIEDLQRIFAKYHDQKQNITGKEQPQER